MNKSVSRYYGTKNNTTISSKINDIFSAIVIALKNAHKDNKNLKNLYKYYVGGILLSDVMLKNTPLIIDIVLYGFVLYTDIRIKELKSGNKKESVFDSFNSNSPIFENNKVSINLSIPQKKDKLVHTIHSTSIDRRNRKRFFVLYQILGVGNKLNTDSDTPISESIGLHALPININIEGERVMKLNTEYTSDITTMNEQIVYTNLKNTLEQIKKGKINSGLKYTQGTITTFNIKGKETNVYDKISIDKLLYIGIIGYNIESIKKHMSNKPVVMETSSSQRIFRKSNNYKKRIEVSLNNKK